MVAEERETKIAKITLFSSFSQPNT